jgi:ribose-phosphate pyrophosphokinase
MYKLKVFSGNANPQLALAIAQYLGTTLSAASISRFSDGEIRVQIQENVRGADVFVIQPTCSPVNDNLMELLIILDALRRASAKRITAVIPYYGYGRQDRQTGPRQPITAKLVADLIVSAGPHRILTLDLHAAQIQGFFNLPLDNLQPDPIIMHYLRERLASNFHKSVIVALSAEGARRARRLARKLNLKFAFIDERSVEREEPYEVMHVVGDITEYAVLVDDIIDTGAGVCKAAAAVLEKGAQHIIACATHGIFSGQAVENIEKSPLEEVMVTNSIPNKSKSKKIVVLSVVPLMGETIRRIHNEESVSTLFVS